MNGAREESRQAVEQCLRYRQAYGRNPGSIARLNDDVPAAEIAETDPWGRPWVLSPEFQDTRTHSNPGDLWVCSRGPAGTGPCPPPDIPAYAGPLAGSAGYSGQFGGWQGRDPWWRSLLRRLPVLLLAVLVLLLPCYIVWYLGYRLYRIGRKLLRRPLKPARPLLDSFMLVAIIGFLAAIAIPNLRSVGGFKPTRAAGDVKTAVTQAIVYAEDTGAYPTSLQVLRNSGYANVADDDPWGVPYRLSPVLARGKTPTKGDNVYIYSKGSQGTGTYPRPFTDAAGARGSIGYSSIYGAWRSE